MPCCWSNRDEGGVGGAFRWKSHPCRPAEGRRGRGARPDDGRPGVRPLVRERGDDAQHVDLVGPLRQRPAEGGQQGHGPAGTPDAVQRQRRRVPQDQADRRPVRHRVGRRALGAEVPQGRADGVLRPLVAGPSKQLYSIARTFPFWQDGSNYMGYPFSWSTVQIYYNPKYVKTKPTPGTRSSTRSTRERSRSRTSRRT